MRTHSTLGKDSAHNESLVDSSHHYHYLLLIQFIYYLCNYSQLLLLSCVLCDNSQI